MNNLQAIKRLHRGKMAAMLIQRREGCYAAPDGTEFRWDDGSHKSENHARHAATVYTAKWLKEDSPMQPPEKSRRDDFARPVVGKNGLNVNIYANLRSDDDMKKLGFTDYGRHWDYSVMMTDNISFHQNAMLLFGSHYGSFALIITPYPALGNRFLRKK